LDNDPRWTRQRRVIPEFVYKYQGSSALYVLILFLFLGLASCSKGAHDHQHAQHMSNSNQNEKIQRYIQYSEIFASSGQPNEAQLKTVAQEGVLRVIYIALTDSHGAIANEDEIVRALGMDYVHIPVDFKHPTLSNFQEFVKVMQAKPEENTLVHCQVNMRASVFSFLFRSIFQDVPVAEAKQGIDAIWEPNEVWFKFIQTVANHYDLDIYCDECDWGNNEFSLSNG